MDDTLKTKRATTPFGLCRRWGPVYWTPGLYGAAMAVLRRGRRRDLFKLIQGAIGDLSVLDLCCGPAELRRWIPRNKYQGLDKSPVFAHSLRRRGVSVTEGDVLTTPWPEAECVVMTDSLYHFLPNVDALLHRVAEHPAKKVILAESVVHLSANERPWLAKVARWATRVDGREFGERFNEPSLRVLFEKWGFQEMVRLPYNLVGLWTRRTANLACSVFRPCLASS
jgi:trans-aconitate methyltransferase